MKSWKKPTPEQVDHAVALLARPAQYRYFFGRLDNPEWVKPLMERGFFSNPLAVVEDEKERTIAFPPWPESRYLARIASVASPDAQTAILEAIQKVPDTENSRVSHDLLEAAIALPADLSVRLVGKAISWARGKYQLLLPEKLGQIVAHWAQGGHTKEALRLAGETLEILPDPRKPPEVGPEKVFLFSPEPISRFDLWNYEQILKKHMPALISAAQENALYMLCRLLDKAIELSKRPDEKGGPSQFSYIWRPAIEEHSQNLNASLKELLVSGVRDAFEQAGREHPEKVPTLVEMLESRKQQIFDRLALHLLRLFSESALHLIADRITNRRNFEDPGLRHEYVLLLEKCFGALAPEDQAKYLGWVDEGPDLAKFRQRYEQWTGASPTEKQETEYVDTWRRDWLVPVAAFLPAEWTRRYRELVSRHGAAEHPEFLSWRREAWVGPRSPVETEKLAAFEIDELVQFLRDWRPPKEWHAPSPEGLGRQLTGLVATEPNAYALAATRFVGLDPTYVRSLIQGLEEAAKKAAVFEWTPVIELCRWVMDQPRDIPGRKTGIDEEDPDWGWTRRSIASLLSAGIEQGPSEIRFDLRAQVWEVIRRLTEDPEPTQEFEAQYGGTNMDPATLSLNTVRGQAFHVVIRYALWVRRQLSKEHGGEKRVAQGFQEMPEVREVLERHLDPRNDPAVTVRAVYGQWFPWLVLLDLEWAKANAARVFPAEEGGRDLWEASMGTYLALCEPYDHVFAVLESEYARAIEAIGSSRTQKHLADPDARLAQHLMVFYLRGKLNLEDEQGLLQSFYRKAPEAVCGWALEFVGRSLRNSNELAAEILERLKRLWVWRLETAKAAACEPGASSSEPRNFGWWFASGKFDDRWAVVQLAEALRVSGTVDPYHLVVERLAELAGRMAGPAVECLDLIVRGDKEGWRIGAYREHARAILGMAIKSRDPKAIATAVDLANHLGELGYFEFGDLLKDLPR